MTFRELEHTADTGLEVEASSLPELLEAAAVGMFRLMYDVPGGGERRRLEFDLPDEEPAELLYDVLAELLWRSEAEGIAVDDVEVSPTDGGWRVTAEGVEPGGVALAGPPIKAVTWHGLTAVPREDGWYGRVIFDL
ncbi:MAG TPA: archease [Actinobacteria bacterium]|nr:archease [Actinomycetota bacterium]